MWRKRRFLAMTAVLALVALGLGLRSAAASTNPTATTPSAPATVHGSDWNISGPIQQMNGQFWYVGGFVFRVDGSTQIVGDVPSIGTNVAATGKVVADGTWVAERVAIGPNASLTATGTAVPSPVTDTPPTSTASATPMAPTATPPAVPSLTSIPSQPPIDEASPALPQPVTGGEGASPPTNPVPSTSRPQFPSTTAKDHPGSAAPSDKRSGNGPGQSGKRNGGKGKGGD